jgi:hypothetical protein
LDDIIASKARDGSKGVELLSMDLFGKLSSIQLKWLVRIDHLLGSQVLDKFRICPGKLGNLSVKLLTCIIAEVRLGLIFIR